MTFLRVMLLLLVAQSVVYVSLLLYLRAARRERLEADYPEAATERERAVFVEAGLRTYQRWLAPRLALAVYLLPLVLLAAAIYIGNFT